MGPTQEKAQGKHRPAGLGDQDSLRDTPALEKRAEQNLTCMLKSSGGGGIPAANRGMGSSGQWGGRRRQGRSLFGGR